PLEPFACRFPPSLDERDERDARPVREWATLAFVTEAATLLLRGPPGVGKPQLAVAVGRRAIAQGAPGGARRLCCARPRPAGGAAARPGRAPPRPPAAHVSRAQSAPRRRVWRLALRPP